MDPPAPAPAVDAGQEVETRPRRESSASQNSQTAAEFIDEQLKLEADAREALPYSFDSCTRPLGALRQILFSCLTCNPPPPDPSAPYTPAGVCYSCSISCHGEHTLVELFNKRNFVCDCGTTRLPSTSPCTLRVDPKTDAKPVHSEEPAAENKYNQNFRNRFCCCGDTYDPHQEKGTMFQCLGLGSVETGGCGEDWYHPECLVGLPRNWNSALQKQQGDQTESKEEPSATVEEHCGNEDPPLPPGFPGEDDFETFLCYKCLDSNPWLKRYAGTPGFLPPVYRNSKSNQTSNGDTTIEPENEGHSKKRKLETDEDQPDTKRPKSDTAETALLKSPSAPAVTKEKHASLPTNPPSKTFSLFVKEDFRDHLCHCVSCFPLLVPHQQLREEEETYEPPLSEAGDGAHYAHSAGSQHTGSLLERGEAALSNLDRVRAIEGVMVYNHLKEKVKDFLKPFAESGTAVGAEDIKAYFEKLRGDAEAIRDAASQRNGAYGSGGDEGDSRRQQSGESKIYFIIKLCPWDRSRG
ncbi:RING-type E3 ubiquitin-protein ligase [Emydomyces testavorans]|uniref:RING-type E3 ubiquitin-protein ligase n=1 Tax=Emydomyces testavorans TaxID=2070801 RepID=A0AAF0IJX6_9EURO|nr:RING-type E3 ubiquitin-protein ligase [Emydomyces testavorans]